MPSLKSNFLYSSILTTAGYVFPLLTFPYLTRILGVSYIGLCSFIDSIVNYFILFSMMGISVTGIREIARVKNDRARLNKTFSSLILLNSIFTLIALIALVIATIFVSQLRDNHVLIVWGGIKLIFNFLLVEWFYKAIENFKYITLRSIITRSIYVILIFLLVNKSQDYTIYYALLCGTTVINAIINVIYSQKFVSFSFKDISIKPYLKSFLILGVNGFLISMYTTFNVSYLGFVANDKEVGYYTTATKLYAIIIALYTAFTGVMLPRMSTLIHQNKTDEFQRLLNKSINFLISCAVPIIFFVEFFAPEIIRLIAGEGYEGAILPMRIVIPLIFIIGYEQILIIQTLMPIKKDSIIFRNSMIGAIAGLILNILIVPYLYSIGSSIVWVGSELIIMILSQIAVTKYLKQEFPLKRIFSNIAYYLPLCMWYGISLLFLDNIGWCIINFMIMILYFSILHILLKDDVGKQLKTILNKVWIK